MKDIFNFSLFGILLFTFLYFISIIFEDDIQHDAPNNATVIVHDTIYIDTCLINKPLNN